MHEYAKFRFYTNDSVFLTVSGTIWVHTIYKPKLRFWKEPKYRVRITGNTMFESDKQKHFPPRTRERKHRKVEKGTDQRRLIEENLYEVAKEVSQVSKQYFGTGNMYRRLMWSVITGSEPPDNFNGERFINTPV